MKRLLCALLVLALAVSCALAFSGCEHVYLSYPKAEMYVSGGRTVTGTVRRVEVDWLSGSVRVVRSEGAGVSFSEEGSIPLTEKTAVHSYLEDGVLYIRFAAAGRQAVGQLHKDLTLTLPSDLPLDRLKIKTTTADVTMENAWADNVRVETASGDVTVSGGTYDGLFELETQSGDLTLRDIRMTGRLFCETSSGNVLLDGADVVGVLDVSTMSGTTSGTVLGTFVELNVSAYVGDIDLTLDGVAKLFELESMSGDIRFASVSGTPAAGEAHAMSGDVTVVLPPDAAFTLESGTITGTFECGFAMRQSGGKYVVGEGEDGPLLRVQSASGKVRILPVGMEEIPPTEEPAQNPD